MGEFVGRLRQSSRRLEDERGAGRPYEEDPDVTHVEFRLGDCGWARGGL